MTGARITSDRDGHPGKAYGNGTILCAATKPFHYPINDDGTCDCITREGKTIATFTMFERDRILKERSRT